MSIYIIPRSFLVYYFVFPLTCTRQEPGRHVKITNRRHILDESFLSVTHFICFACPKVQIMTHLRQQRVQLVPSSRSTVVL
jgi:hypothetical protein